MDVEHLDHGRRTERLLVPSQVRGRRLEALLHDVVMAREVVFDRLVHRS